MIREKVEIQSEQLLTNFWLLLLENFWGKEYTLDERSTPARPWDFGGPSTI